MCISVYDFFLDYAVFCFLDNNLFLNNLEQDVLS